MPPAPGPASHSQPPASAVPTFSARTRSRARVSTAAAAAYPCVNRIANASSRTSTVGGGSGTRGRGAGGLGRLLQAAGAVQVGGPHRGPERLQVRLARQADVERLQAPGCAQEQPGTVADTALVISDLPAQALQLGQ